MPFAPVNTTYSKLQRSLILASAVWSGPQALVNYAGNLAGAPLAEAESIIAGFGQAQSDITVLCLQAMAQNFTAPQPGQPTPNIPVSKSVSKAACLAYSFSTSAWRAKGALVPGGNPAITWQESMAPGVPVTMPPRVYTLPGGGTITMPGYVIYGPSTPAPAIDDLPVVTLGVVEAGYSVSVIDAALIYLGTAALDPDAAPAVSRINTIAGQIAALQARAVALLS